MKILDTGCGNGILSEVLRHEMAESQSENLQVTGIDSSEAMVKAANERIKVKGWKNDSASVADMQVRKGLCRQGKLSDGLNLDSVVVEHARPREGKL